MMIYKKLLQISKGRLAKNTLWMMLGYGLRTVFQTGYFVLISRSLGVEQFGVFGGLWGLVSIFVPFTDWGSGTVLVMYVARARETFARYWGIALELTLFFTMIFVFLLLGLQRLLFGEAYSFGILLLFAISELFLMKLVDISSLAFVAFEKLTHSALLLVFVSAARFTAAIFFWLSGGTSLTYWLWAYMLATLISALVAIGMVSWFLGLPRFQKVNLPILREGFFFAFGVSAKSIYTDIDKTLLLRLGTMESTGIYTAAYRLINLAIIPLQSLLLASYSDFFRQGIRGMAANFAKAVRLIGIGFLYGLLFAIVLWIFAPFVPLFLGDKYQQVSEALRWLAFVPAVQAIHYMLGNALSGANYQAQRSYAQVGVAIFNLVLNVWLIPLYGWRGAALTTLMSESMLALIFFILIQAIRTAQLRAQKVSQ